MADQDISSVTDTTEWLNTPLSGLSSVEATLRCQICRDFYTTPMLTTCLHTFCSLCIRRSLANDGRCPLCRAPDQESKLRWNGALDDVVDAYVKTRIPILTFARQSVQKDTNTPKRKPQHLSPEQPSQRYSKRLRTSTRPSGSPEPKIVVPKGGPSEPDDKSLEDCGIAHCPICNQRMKEWQVFGHLDKCSGPEAMSLPPNPDGDLEVSKQNPSPRRPQSRMERLPALNYSMIKEPVLRKKLNELGLSSIGPRSLLERRHKEWSTIWNANCDAVDPKSRTRLLHDLDAWERTQGGRTPGPSRGTSSIKDKEFDGNAWAAKYEDSFKDLIANARKSRLPIIKAPESSETNEVDT